MCAENQKWTWTMVVTWASTAKLPQRCWHRLQDRSNILLLDCSSRTANAPRLSPTSSPTWPLRFRQGSWEGSAPFSTPHSFHMHWSPSSRRPDSARLDVTSQLQVQFNSQLGPVLHAAKQSFTISPGSTSNCRPKSVNVLTDTSTQTTFIL